MYDRLKRLYSEGKINDHDLESAVAKGWITEDEMLEILDSAEVTA